MAMLPFCPQSAHCRLGSSFRSSERICSFLLVALSLDMNTRPPGRHIRLDPNSQDVQKVNSTLGPGVLISSQI